MGEIDSMRRQELKSRKKVHAHKKSKKRWHMGAYSRRETTFVEYKPEVVIVKEMKTPRNARNA